MQHPDGEDGFARDDARFPDPNAFPRFEVLKPSEVMPKGRVGRGDGFLSEGIDVFL
jgi:hypothetical protein